MSEGSEGLGEVPARAGRRRRRVAESRSSASSSSSPSLDKSEPVSSVVVLVRTSTSLSRSFKVVLRVVLVVDYEPSPSRIVDLIDDLGSLLPTLHRQPAASAACDCSSQPLRRHPCLPHPVLSVSCSSSLDFASLQRAPKRPAETLAETDHLLRPGRRAPVVSGCRRGDVCRVRKER